MKTSIALCTYNGEKFLREQLDSIALQTLLPDELVACDDRSCDSTMEILQEFRERVSFPVHIHQNEENLGSTKNFEKAIRLCSGDIIALCDQDDVWKPEKLERLGEALHANPEAGYAFSDADLVDEHLKPLGCRLWDSIGFRGEIKKLFIQGEQLRCFIRKNVVTGASMIFRASVGRMAMPFPTKGDFWVHDGWIALISSTVGHLGVPVDEALISYRIHPNQQMGFSDQPQKKQSLLYKYHELKINHQLLFDIWEKHCLGILNLKDILLQLQETVNSPDLEKNLTSLMEFETHFLNRRKIMTSPKTGCYLLLLQEVFSGRYAKYSNSWRTIFRDFLF